MKQNFIFSIKLIYYYCNSYKVLGTWRPDIFNNKKLLLIAETYLVECFCWKQIH